jgi:hypothetical protein
MKTTKCYRLSTNCKLENLEYCPTDYFVDFTACKNAHDSAHHNPHHNLLPPGPTTFPSTHSTSNQMKNQVIEAHQTFRRDSVYRDSSDNIQHPSEIEWDDKLEKSSEIWAQILIDDCGNEKKMDRPPSPGGPGQSVTKVTGASDPLHYSWSDVVDNWLYEGCKEKPSMNDSHSRQSLMYGHYMTATLKNQNSVGCSSKFKSKCPATGKSLQVYVCDYKRSAHSDAFEDYPSDTTKVSLCSNTQPFPVNLV